MLFTLEGLDALDVHLPSYFLHSVSIANRLSTGWSARNASSPLNQPGRARSSPVHRFQVCSVVSKFWHIFSTPACFMITLMMPGSHPNLEGCVKNVINVITTTRQNDPLSAVSRISGAGSFIAKNILISKTCVVRTNAGGLAMLCDKMLQGTPQVADGGALLDGTYEDLQDKLQADRNRNRMDPKPWKPRVLVSAHDTQLAGGVGETLGLLFEVVQEPWAYKRQRICGVCGLWGFQELRLGPFRRPFLARKCQGHGVLVVELSNTFVGIQLINRSSHSGIYQGNTLLLLFMPACPLAP